MDDGIFNNPWKEDAEPAPVTQRVSFRESNVKPRGGDGNGHGIGLAAHASFPEGSSDDASGRAAALRQIGAVAFQLASHLDSPEYDTLGERQPDKLQLNKLLSLLPHHGFADQRLASWWEKLCAGEDNAVETLVHDHPRLFPHPTNRNLDATPLCPSGTPNLGRIFGDRFRDVQSSCTSGQEQCRATLEALYTDTLAHLLDDDTLPPPDQRSALTLVTRVTTVLWGCCERCLV
ncbi:hypothetical protein PG988_004936 [Apiospora saccharicola]